MAERSPRVTLLAMELGFHWGWSRGSEAWLVFTSLGCLCCLPPSLLTRIPPSIPPSTGIPPNTGIPLSTTPCSFHGHGKATAAVLCFNNLPCSAEYTSARLAGSASFALRYQSHHWSCLSDSSPGRNAPGSRGRAGSPGGIYQAAPGVSSHFSAPHFCPLKNGSTKGPWPQAGLKSITHVKYKVRVLGCSKHFINANQSTHMDGMASHCADARSLLEMRPDPPASQRR